MKLWSEKDSDELWSCLGCLGIIVLIVLIFGGIGLIVEGLSHKGEYVLTAEERKDLKEAGEILQLDKATVADYTHSYYRKSHNYKQVCGGIAMLLVGVGVIVLAFTHDRLPRRKPKPAADAESSEIHCAWEAPTIRFPTEKDDEE